MGPSLLLDVRERVSAEKRRAFPGLSLQGIFGGHTCWEADGSHHQPSSMIFIELRACFPIGSEKIDLAESIVDEPDSGRVEFYLILLAEDPGNRFEVIPVQAREL